MKKITVVLLLVYCSLTYAAFAQSDIKVAIVITNPYNFERKEELVSVSWDDVISKYPSIDPANFRIINAITQKEVAYQLEYRGETAIQNLLVQVDVAANNSLKLILQTGKPGLFTAKTYSRFVPERKDDFAWENDKIAFRMYGKAIEGTSEDAYGIDVWVKSTDKLILNERYKRGKYHIDQGDGMDYYHVGLTLGAGNIAPYVNDTICYSKNYHNWKILDNGPLRSTFQLYYDEWNVVGMPVKAVKTISLDAGSLLNRIEATYQYKNNIELPIVVGIVKRKEAGTMLLDEQKGIMAYWEPQHGADGITGIGSILLSPVVSMQVNNEQLLTQIIAKNNEPIIYYTGAAWNKAQTITNAKAWFNYLQIFQQRLQQPMKVTVHKAND